MVGDGVFATSLTLLCESDGLSDKVVASLTKTAKRYNKVATTLPQMASLRAIVSSD